MGIQRESSGSIGTSAATTSRICRSRSGSLRLGPVGQNGRSLAAAIRGGGDAPRRPILSQLTGRITAVSRLLSGYVAYIDRQAAAGTGLSLPVGALTVRTPLADEPDIAG